VTRVAGEDLFCALQAERLGDDHLHQHPARLPGARPKLTPVVGMLTAGALHPAVPELTSTSTSDFAKLFGEFFFSENYINAT
jgi:hypothetical protein